MYLNNVFLLVLHIQVRVLVARVKTVLFSRTFLFPLVGPQGAPRWAGKINSLQYFIVVLHVHTWCPVLRQLQTNCLSKPWEHKGSELTFNSVPCAPTSIQCQVAVSSVHIERSCKNAMYRNLTVHTHTVLHTSYFGELGCKLFPNS